MSRCLRRSATLLLALAAAVGLALPAGAAERPNVVVVMTDDQTLEQLRFLPQTQELVGAAGAEFTSAYSSFPLCCPSRATYLTGRYAHNHGIVSNGGDDGGYANFDGEHSLPVWLRDAGYDTVHIGKYLNGYGAGDPEDVPPGWTDWHGAIDPYTYWNYGFWLNHNGRVQRYGTPSDERPAYYQTDVYARLAVQEIEERARGDRPFFLNLAMLASHGEVPSAAGLAQNQFGGEPFFVSPRPAERHASSVPDAAIARTAATNEADVSDKPAWLRNQFPSMTAQQLGAADGEYRQRARSLLAVDDAVGSVIDALQRTGQLEHTYVLFVSDNGFMEAEHRIPGGKFVPYEPSVRVPLLLRGPGVPAGVRTDELVANVDLTPTILEIAGAAPTRSLDGRSLIPYAKHPELRTDRPILLETQGTGTMVDDIPEGMPFAPPSVQATLAQLPPYRALRWGRWKYVEYTTQERELYDLEADPLELESRHADPAYADLAAELSTALAELAACSDETCRAGVQVGGT